MQEKDLQIVMFFSREIIQGETVISTIIKKSNDDFRIKNVIPSPLIRLIKASDCADMYDVKKALARKWFKEYMYHFSNFISNNEDFNEMLVDFIGDDIIIE